jgi:hypothetical protein
VFENRELRRILGGKRDKNRRMEKVANEELHTLYSSPNIIRHINPRRMRAAGHVACMGEER